MKVFNLLKTILLGLLIYACQKNITISNKGITNPISYDSDYFITKIGGNNYYNGITHIFENQNEDIFVTGYSNQYGLGTNFNGIVGELNTNVLAYSESYTANEYHKKTLELPGQNYIIAGTAYGSEIGSSDISMTKFTPNGGKEWMMMMGGKKADVLEDMILNNNNTFSIGSTTESFGVGKKDIMITEHTIDLNGKVDLLNSRIYGTVADEKIYKLLKTAENQLYFAGYTDPNDKYAIVCKETDRNLDWCLSLNINYNQEATSIINLNHSDDVIAAGNFQNILYPSKSNVFVAKISSDGALKDIATLDFYSDHRVYSIEKDSYDNIYLFVINTKNKIDKTEIIKLDKNFKFIWGESLIDENVGILSSYMTSDNDLLFAGYADKEINRNQQKILIGKIPTNKIWRKCNIKKVVYSPTNLLEWTYSDKIQLTKSEFAEPLFTKYYNPFTATFVPETDHQCSYPIPTNSPTNSPTLDPTDWPSIDPTNFPTLLPSESPSKAPSNNPSKLPTSSPTFFPTFTPTKNPTESLTYLPTSNPNKSPSFLPSTSPSYSPIMPPTNLPTYFPTHEPTLLTLDPTINTPDPTSFITADPTISSINPTKLPSNTPTRAPSLITLAPSINPTTFPSDMPTISSDSPTLFPSDNPTISPTDHTQSPSLEPTVNPTSPTHVPTVTTHNPTLTTTHPTQNPSSTPTEPSISPTQFPTKTPTLAPTFDPTGSTIDPTYYPTYFPTASTSNPTISPTTTAENQNVAPHTYTSPYHNSNKFIFLGLIVGVVLAISLCVGIYLCYKKKSKKSPVNVYGMTQYHTVSQIDNNPDKKQNKKKSKSIELKEIKRVSSDSGDEDSKKKNPLIIDNQPILNNTNNSNENSILIDINNISPDEDNSPDIDEEIQQNNIESKPKDTRSKIGENDFYEKTGTQQYKDIAYIVGAISSIENHENQIKQNQQNKQPEKMRLSITKEDLDPSTLEFFSLNENIKNIGIPQNQIKFNTGINPSIGYSNDYVSWSAQNYHSDDDSKEKENEDDDEYEQEEEITWSWKPDPPRRISKLISWLPSGRRLYTIEEENSDTEKDFM